MQKKKRQSRKSNVNDLAFFDHARELKRRGLISLGCIILFVIIGYIYKDNIFGYALKLGESAGYRFIYAAPQALFVQQLRLLILSALMCSSPFVIYEILAFVIPAFEVKKRTVFIGIIFMYLLFASGFYFSYKIILPFSLNYLQGMSSDVESLVNIADYCSFLITLLMSLGIVFELPLVSIILTKIGIINSKKMLKAWKFVIVGAFIVGAIITPPDVISQCIVAVPIILLYLISVLICVPIKSKVFISNEIELDHKKVDDQDETFQPLF